MSKKHDIMARVVCSTCKTDTFERCTWTGAFADYEAVVMTPQVCLTMLRLRFLEMESIKLFVFDSCHQAQGHHPYRLIMDEIYRLISPSRRPQILGLTSLPPRDSESASCLATTLDACYLVPDIPDMFTPKVAHTTVAYVVRPDKGREKALKLIQRIKDDQRFRSALRAFKYALPQFGSWGAYHLWCHSLSAMMQFTHTRPKDGIEPMEEQQQQENQLSMEAVLEDALQSREELAGIEADLSNVSDKMKKLCNILQEAYTTRSSEGSFRAVILVQRRLEAFILHTFLRLAADMKTFGLDALLVGLFIGHPSSSSSNNYDNSSMGKPSMTLDEQQRMLDRFASGEINLLVASAATEDTLEIPPCDLVVRFDPPTTLETYFLSQNLVRDGNAKYIILQSSDCKDTVKPLQDQAARMRQWCQRQAQHTPRSRKVRMEDDMDTESTTGSIDEYEDSSGNEILVSETNAKITLDSAVLALSLYCRMLPRPPGGAPYAPKYESGVGPDGFTVTVVLPAEYSPKPWFANPVPMSRKRDARKAAALEACKGLYFGGFMDGDLLPSLMGKEATLEIQELPPPAKQKGKGDQPSVEGDLPDYWKKNVITIGSGQPRLMFMTTFTLCEKTANPRKYRTMAILTPSPLGRLTSIDVYFDGVLNVIEVVQMKNPVFVQESEMEDMHEFHSRVLNHAYRKPVDVGCLNGAWYVFAPLVRDICSLDPLAHAAELRKWIDWEELARTAKAQFDIPMDSVPYETLMAQADDLVVFERSMRTRLFYTKSVYQDREEYDQLRRQLEQEIQEMNKSNALMDPVKEPSHYAIFPVDRVPRIENNLQTEAKLKRRHRTNRTRILSDLCCIVPVSATISRMYHLLPAILNRLDSLAMAEGFRFSFDLSPTLQSRFEQDLLMESLTASVTGMSVSYQRLEMLGDTFVKFLTTTDLFIRCPLSEEGRLTLMRRDAISNQALYELADTRKLYRYLTTFPMPTWHHEQSGFRQVPVGYAKPIMATNAPTITVAMPPAKQPPPSNRTTGSGSGASDKVQRVSKKDSPGASTTEGMTEDTDMSTAPSDVSVSESPADMATAADGVSASEMLMEGTSCKAAQTMTVCTATKTITTDTALSEQQLPGTPAKTTTKGQPPPPPKPKSRKLQLSRKMMADMIESTLGAAYVSGGRDLALPLAQQLGHPMAKEVQTWNDFSRLWEARMVRIREDLASARPQITKLYPLTLAAIMSREAAEAVLAGENNRKKRIDYRRLEHVLGYQFRDRRLLIEALAHPTIAKGYTYQRLEFLGDAVIDMITVEYWFHRQPQGDQGTLTAMKVESVNQHVLGCLALMLGLHLELLHENPLLPNEWRVCVAKIGDALDLQDVDERDRCKYEALPPIRSRLMARERRNGDKKQTEEVEAAAAVDKEIEGLEEGGEESKKKKKKKKKKKNKSRDDIDGEEEMQEERIEKIEKVSPSKEEEEEVGEGGAEVGAEAGYLSFEDFVPYLRRRAQAEQDHDLPPFWTNIAVPKATGDIFESVIGAVFQDAGFTMPAPERCFRKTLKVLLDLFLSPDSLKEHPVKTLLEGLQRRGCIKCLIQTVPVPNMLKRSVVATTAPGLAATGVGVQGPSSSATGQAPTTAYPGVEYPYFEYFISDAEDNTEEDSGLTEGAGKNVVRAGTKRVYTEDGRIEEKQVDSQNDASTEQIVEVREKKRVRLSIETAQGVGGSSSLPLSSPPVTPTTAISVPSSTASSPSVAEATVASSSPPSQAMAGKGLRQAELTVHGHLVLRATHLDIPEARKAVARRAIEIFLGGGGTAGHADEEDGANQSHNLSTSPSSSASNSGHNNNSNSNKKKKMIKIQREEEAILEMPLLDRFCNCPTREKLKEKLLKIKAKREGQ
ncbi:Dicer-like protein 1 [Actinomortierella wolfii]|nr:Dicer-like protein 1 [Actinomortierella wolfii]